MKRESLPTDRSSLALWGMLAVFLLWLAWLLFGKSLSELVTCCAASDAMAKYGQLGDMFGSINALFTGLAFAAFIWTGMVQRHQAALQHAEIQQQWLVLDQQSEAAKRGALQTIAMDVRVAEMLAGVYLRDEVPLPAYRIPLHGGKSALPALVASGSLAGPEAIVLSQFYIDAESFNLGIDLAQEYFNSNQAHFQSSVEIIKLKATHLRAGSDPSRFDDAVRVLKAHLPDAQLDPLDVGGSDVISMSEVAQLAFEAVEGTAFATAAIDTYHAPRGALAYIATMLTFRSDLSVHLYGKQVPSRQLRPLAPGAFFDGRFARGASNIEDESGRITITDVSIDRSQLEAILDWIRHASGAVE